MITPLLGHMDTITFCDRFLTATILSTFYRSNRNHLTRSNGHAKQNVPWNSAASAISREAKPLPKVAISAFFAAA